MRADRLVVLLADLNVQVTSAAELAGPLTDPVLDRAFWDLRAVIARAGARAVQLERLARYDEAPLRKAE